MKSIWHSIESSYYLHTKKGSKKLLVYFYAQVFNNTEKEWKSKMKVTTLYCELVHFEGVIFFIWIANFFVYMFLSI